MSHVVPDAHPDRDTLADLAADVLPRGQAAELQTHVQTCEQCAGLLADAERVRGLLLADDPGPMPAHVLARIETALAAQPRPASVTALGAPGHARRLGRLGQPAARAARGPQRTRRQVREEQRGSGPGRRGTLLLAAAAVALVVAGGGLGLRQLYGGVDAGTASSGGGSGDAAAEQAPAAAADQGVVVATGTRYTERTLAGQVDALVKRVSAARVQADDGTRAGTGLERKSAGGDEALRSPAALHACLAALDSGGEQPLAVDLARYENREAAIVVLPGRDGGYEVWAVARSCGPDGDGTLKFAAVRP